MLAPVHLDMIRKCENVLTLFDGEGSYSLRNSSMLRERKALYGIYHIYSSFNTSEMRPDQWLDYYKMYQSSFIFMLPSDSCSEEDQKEASSFIYDARLHQKFPYYIVDFYSDIKEISRMISGTDCYLKLILPDRSCTLTLPRYLSLIQGWRDILLLPCLRLSRPLIIGSGILRQDLYDNPAGNHSFHRSIA